MKYALIIGGVVDTISLEQQEAPWVQVPEEVFGGWATEGDGFSPPANASPVLTDYELPFRLLSTPSRSHDCSETVSRWQATLLQQTSNGQLRHRLLSPGAIRFGRMHMNNSLLSNLVHGHSHRWPKCWPNCQS